MASFKNFNPSIGPSALQTAIGTAQNLADRSLLAQDKIRRQESEDLRNQALTASIAYQAEDRKQKQKVLKGQELSQRFAATAVDDFINNPFRFVDKDGNFDVSALAETKYGPFNLQSSYSQYKNLIDTEGVDAEGNSLGLIPDINTFQNTYDTLSNMESMNKLNSIMQYAQEKQMSKDTFNKFLRGAGESQGFTGTNLIENLLNQTTPEYYQTFVANTGFEPRYQTFAETVTFTGPKKATPGQIITTGGAAIGTGIIGKKVLGSEAFRGKPSQFTAYNVDPKETLKVLRQQAKDLGVKTGKGETETIKNLTKAIQKQYLPKGFKVDSQTLGGSTTADLHKWIDEYAPDLRKFGKIGKDGKVTKAATKEQLLLMRKAILKRANALVAGKATIGGFSKTLGKGARSIAAYELGRQALTRGGEAIGGEVGGRICGVINALATSESARRAFGKLLRERGGSIGKKAFVAAMADTPAFGIGDLIALGYTLGEIYRLYNDFADMQGISSNTPP